MIELNTARKIEYRRKLNSVRQASYLTEIRKLMNINRYQNKFRYMHTTISDHEWNVAVIAYWLGRMNEELFDYTVDYKLLLGKALHHDSIKIFVGDIQATPNNKELTSYVNKNLHPYIYESNFSNILPAEIADHYKELILNSKDDTYEGKLVFLANKIDKLIESKNEILLGNSKYFSVVVKDQEEVIKEFIRNNNADGKFDLHLQLFKRAFGLFQGSKATMSKEVDDYIDCFSNYIEMTSDLLQIKRYQNLFKTIDRNVGSHQWSVSRIAYYIASLLEEEGVVVDFKKLITTTLMHDNPECVVGDILSYVKKMTPQMQTIVEQTEEKVFDDIISLNVPEPWRADFKQKMLNPKDDTLEGFIIKIADNIDVMLESLEEIEVGNRTNFIRIFNSTVTALDKQMAGCNLPEKEDEAISLILNSIVNNLRERKELVKRS